MTRLRLWTRSTLVILTGVISLIFLISVLVIFSTAVCSFIIGILGFISTCVLLVPALILRTSKTQEITSSSDLELYRLLVHARNITIKKDDETLTLKSSECYFRVTTNAGIKYVDRTGSSAFYSIVEGLLKGHTIIIDNVQLVLV